MNSEAGHMLLGQARVKAWSHGERATRIPGKLHEEVGDGKSAVFGFEAGPGCSDPCCVYSPAGGFQGPV